MSAGGDNRRMTATLSPAALRLGYAGLVPFVLGAALVWIVHPEVLPYATLSLAAYAATVVSFLGGIHWGIGFREAQPEGRLFVNGVVPPLVAWAGVMMPANAGLVVLGVMLVVCYLMDRGVYQRHGMGHWLTLRFRLSAIASLSCFLGAAGAGS